MNYVPTIEALLEIENFEGDPSIEGNQDHVVDDIIPTSY
jgi:hypothetical protein